MKTHKIVCLLLVCLIAFSCKKDDGIVIDDPITGADADYSLLMTSANGFETILLDANLENMTLSPATSNFPMSTVPDLNFKEENVFSFYGKSGNCSGTFLRYNFEDETFKQLDLFADLGTCNLESFAVAHNGDTGYIAYGLDNGTSTGYYVRAFNLNGPSDDFTDILLSKRPVHLSFANDRLFVLTIDDEITNENSLTVIDASNNSELIEMGLGYDAQKLIRNSDNNIIVSYDELHTLLNSQSLSPEYVQYQADKRPEFVHSTVNNFANESTMYFDRPSGVYSNYPIIPASYDFVRNLSTLYPFEAYLTQSQRELEYEIETTTMVGYDTKNGYMLIGYKKIGQNKGGILRVRTGDDPAVIDNFDVDGVPYNIIAM